MTLLLALLLTPPATAEEPRQPGWTLVLPFGAPQYIQRRPGWGAGFMTAQALGVGGAVWSGVAIERAVEAEDYERELQLRAVSAVTVGLTAASWFGSVLDGARYYQLQGEQMAAQAQAWRRSSTLAQGG